MLWRLLDLARVDADILLQRAERVQFRAAEDRVAGRGLGPVGRGGPSRAGVQDDALVEPVGGGGGGAGGSDDAAAVGEEGDGEGRPGVEVLADEEVAVVEGGGGEADEELVGLWGGVGDFGDLETGDEG